MIVIILPASMAKIEQKSFVVAKFEEIQSQYQSFMVAI